MKKILIVDVPDWATGYRVTLNGGVLPNIGTSVKELTPPTDEEIDNILENETRCTISDDDDLDDICNFYWKYEDVKSAINKILKQLGL